jgi:hypothetical protein
MQAVGGEVVALAKTRMVGDVQAGNALLLRHRAGDIVERAHPRLDPGAGSRAERHEVPPRR